MFTLSSYNNQPPTIPSEANFKLCILWDSISSFEGPYTLFLYCKFEAYFFGYQLQLNGSCRCQIKHLLGQQISIHSLGHLRHPTKKVKPSWFGFPVLINKKYLSKKKKFLNLLNQRGIETRMIISGNFMNHSGIQIYNLNPNKRTFNNAQEIEDRGFFIGLHTESISEETLNYLEKNLLTIDKL